MVKWTKKDIQQLKRLCKQGKKTREIADIIDRTMGSVAAKINTLQQRGELPYKHKGKKSFNHVMKKVKGQEKMTAQKVIATWGKPYTHLTYKKHDDMMKMPKSSSVKITETLYEIEAFLLAKNKQYGDSVLQPIRIFSKADKSEQLKVRIDDKLNRLVQGDSSIEADEDVIKDLIGYFILLLIQLRD